MVQRKEKESEVTQSCLTLCDPMDCSPTRLLRPWDFPGKDTGVGYHFLLQGIFPTQGSNLNLLKSPALAGRFFTASATWEAPNKYCYAVLCLVPQSCPTLCDPVNCSPPGSSVHGLLQARISEWVAMHSSRGSSQPRDPTQASHIAGRFFTI